MVVAVSAGLRATAVTGGLVIGIVAVALAQLIPIRMDRMERPRSTTWWLGAVVVAVVFGWIAAGAVEGWALLPAYLVFGATTLAVTLTDIDHQLIPNRILFPGLGLAAVLLAVGALIDGSERDLGRAVVAAIAYFAVLLVVGLVARGGFGMGDVKLALLLGLFLGFVGWDALGVGFCLGILLGGVASLALLIFTKRGRRSKFAYGPYMVVGAWIGLFWGPQIANWYLGG
jgi:leader peptidase (prepilin peptidase)/N-methyltransferase